MKTALRTKLHQYIVDHNPELLLSLQEDFKVSNYINDKIEVVMPKVRQWLADGVQLHETQQRALKEMTSELRPSKYLFLNRILEEEFKDDFEKFTEAGVLTYELVNLIEVCRDTFTAFRFSEQNEDNRLLRYAIIADIANYLN
ncbi:DUF1896 family protein [Pedobacter insulae]|uniref:Uncharacterized protein n=1 Tax=Pedobacter insulae TaxID=414048 RepID=A0A1I2ZJ36_9SPHI|nr:DUF1896 family protein [Pedobacter insulae]SFH37862.1 protein of unknown function [Pedobacter insulae]